MAASSEFGPGCALTPENWQHGMLGPALSLAAQRLGKGGEGRPGGGDRHDILMSEPAHSVHSDLPYQFNWTLLLNICRF